MTIYKYFRLSVRSQSSDFRTQFSQNCLFPISSTDSFAEKYPLQWNTVDKAFQLGGLGARWAVEPWKSDSLVMGQPECGLSFYHSMDLFFQKCCDFPPLGCASVNKTVHFWTLFGWVAIEFFTRFTLSTRFVVVAFSCNLLAKIIFLYGVSPANHHYYHFKLK
jgi:hypothetical protein